MVRRQKLHNTLGVTEANDFTVTGHVLHMLCNCIQNIYTKTSDDWKLQRTFTSLLKTSRGSVLPS